MISYASNCTVRVGSGVWLVQQQAPCANGTTEVDFTTRMNQQAEPPPGGGLDPNVEAGLVVGGAAVIATRVFWWCQHGDRPASP